MGVVQPIEEAYKIGFSEGVRLMEQRMLLAAEHGTPINYRSIETKSAILSSIPEFKADLITK